MLTIGYGHRAADEFVALLHRHKIAVLVDIRTTPFSRFRPQFSKGALAGILELAGIGYVFMGQTLGGRPEDASCYTGGVVDYAKIRRRAFFERGLKELEALRDSAAKGFVAIMGAELEPQRCHRALLVGEALADQGVGVRHIDGAGELVTQNDVRAGGGADVVRKGRREEAERRARGREGVKPRGPKTRGGAR